MENVRMILSYVELVMSGRKQSNSDGTSPACSYDLLV